MFVLPNNSNIIMAAQQCQGLTEKKVVVIPSKTVPQGITAMMGVDPEGSVETITAAMTEALSTVTTSQNLPMQPAILTLTVLKFTRAIIWR